MNKNQVSDLPAEYYYIAREVADGFLPLLQHVVADLADEHDVPTALSIGASALTYLLVGLGDTYDIQFDQEPDAGANEVMAGKILDAINERMLKSLARSNGELN